MRLRVIRPFGSYSQGDTIPEVPGGQADLLIARGFCELDDGELVETAALADPPENAMLHRHKQRKQRP